MSATRLDACFVGSYDALRITNAIAPGEALNMMMDCTSTGGRRRRSIWALIVALPALTLSCAKARPESKDEVLFEDGFARGEIDAAKWVRTRTNDFELDVVDIVDGRLRIAAATVGTDDRTVKFHGVRTRKPVVDLSHAVKIGFELDWNKQANGSYMTAGAYVCPTESQNPREERNWLRIQYIGVPPGKNGRCLVSVKRAGVERKLLTEDWPRQRLGRKIGVQRLRIVLDQDTIRVTENDTVILTAAGLGVPFTQAYLYLQHSSHSNYRRREVFFDNVTVRK